MNTISLFYEKLKIPGVFTIDGNYLLRNLYDIPNNLKDFCTFDFTFVIYQIEINPKNIENACLAENSNYEFVRMLFGLKNDLPS